MQFWFNLTAVNESEDIIEANFHIYKKRAPILQTLKTHFVTVRVTSFECCVLLIYFTLISIACVTE